MKSNLKSLEQLAQLNAYCVEHPNERLFQAIYNCFGRPNGYTALGFLDESVTTDQHPQGFHDTFYMEWKTPLHPAEL